MTESNSGVIVDLDELERLEKAAMPGPWFGATSNKDACHWWGKFPANAPDCVVLSSKTFEGVDSEPIPACCTNDDGMATEDEVSNAHFIAAIRNAAPEMIRELRELRKERDELAAEDERLLAYARKVKGSRDVHSVYEVLDDLAAERDRLRAKLEGEQ